MENRLFGTDGVRGLINRDLTPDVALRLGLAIGTFFGEGSRILVGRDVRRGGKMIVNALISGLLSTGIEVYNCGLLPTPTLQYNVMKGRFDGGVIVTASHNPPQYNGIKVVGSKGIEITREDEREIEKYYFAGKFDRVDWRRIPDRDYMYEKAAEIYVNDVLKQVDVELIKSKKFKVIIDCANSVGALTTPIIAKKLGCRVLTINGNLDPDFSWREPEPTVNSLKDTALIVRQLNADLGVGHDGDADRSIFIDDRGRVMWGDRSAAIIAKYLARKLSGRKVFTAVSSSLLVEEVLNPLGIEVVWLKVGSVGISYEMLKHDDTLCGFEENGGFIYPRHQYVRDGGMTFALMLQLLAEENRKLSELYDELPKYYSEKIKIPMERSKALEAVERIKEHFINERIITIDGAKVIFSDGWVLVRPSGTEPVLRIMAEAKTKEKLNWILKEVKQVIGGEAN